MYQSPSFSLWWIGNSKQTNPLSFRSGRSLVSRTTSLSLQCQTKNTLVRSKDEHISLFLSISVSNNSSPSRLELPGLRDHLFLRNLPVKQNSLLSTPHRTHFSVVNLSLNIKKLYTHLRHITREITSTPFVPWSPIGPIGPFVPLTDSRKIRTSKHIIQPSLSDRMGHGHLVVDV